MDRLRVVTFSPGGRPITRLDINDGTIYTLIRDAIQFTAPERQQQWSESLIRYGGAELTQESHKNAQLTAEWYVSGSGSADTALQRLETMMIELESLDGGRYIEWRPENATKSTYFPIKAPSAWEFMYRWIEFQATKTLHLKAGWTVAPLAEGERMTIVDPLDVDSSADYTSLVGGALAYSAGNLALAATQRVGYHSARGYRYGDAQATIKFRTGGTVAAGDVIGTIGAAADANNYIWAQVTGTALTINKRVAGVETQLATVAVSALAASTTYWVTLRKEGNLVTAELWTAQPTITGTPAATVNTTLAGGDATQFGVGTTGFSGYRAQAATPANWSIQEFRVEPYTYTITNPARVDVSGQVPGDAPAIVGMTVGQTGLSTPFALLGWAKTPGGGTAAPFGIFEAEAATLSTWAATADAAYRGGNGAKVTTAGSGSATAVFAFDPSFMAADDFGRGEVDIEVWARVQLASGVVSPVLTASAEPTAGTSFGPSRYTQEWGASGKLLTRPSGGTPLRLVRIGTLTFNTQQSISWNLRLVASWAVGSTGVFGLDYIVLVPAQSRAASPTGKTNDSTYPQFISTTSAVQRTINSDLSTRTATPGSNSYPDAGLAGSSLQIKPGNFSFVYKTSEIVPDDPAATSTGETVISTTNKVQFSVIPRYFLPRG